MLIKGLQKTTLLDYPGKLAATIFIAGCNFRCPFCQNKDLILPELIEELKTYSNKEIFEFLKKRQGILEAVVVTGGEPTLNTDLSRFINRCKQMDYLVKLDTNGTNPEMVEKLLKERLLDYVALDYKGPIEKYYKYIFQIPNSKNQIPNKFKIPNSKIKNKIKETIKVLLQNRIDFELRTTVVPTLHKRADLVEMAKDLKKFLVLSSRSQVFWFIQQFRPKNCLDSKFDKIKPYKKEWFEKVLEEVKKYLFNTKLRRI